MEGQDLSSEEEVEYEPEDFEFDQFKLSVTTISFLPITLLMKNRTKDVEISGQKLWCGSLVVVSYIMKNPSLIQNSVCIELGAGTGVVSMIANRLGAALAIATDHDERSIRNMTIDGDRNSVPILVQRFNWYDPQLDDLVEQISRKIDFAPNYVLLAGDVLYKAALLEPFFQTVSLLFQQLEQVSMILCHIPRAGVTPSMVEETCQRYHLTITPVNRELWLTDASYVYNYSPIEDIEGATLYLINQLN
jgi:hypothetical protein